MFLKYLFVVFELCYLALGETPVGNLSVTTATGTIIVYKLFNEPNQTEAIFLTKQNIKTVLDPTIKTVVILHGWSTSEISSPWYKPLKDSFMKREKYNVITVDWCRSGSKSYLRSVYSVIFIGKNISGFLITAKIRPENIQLIGHSLGAHIASFVGKYIYQKTNTKIARLTALDPAGPLFEMPPVSKSMRLCNEDANFVDAYHTDIHNAGYSAPLAHVDFYPNGGTSQPGCPSFGFHAMLKGLFQSVFLEYSLDTCKQDSGTEGRSCSHNRAILYFIESLSKVSLAQKAEYINDTIEVIKNGTIIVFGQDVPQKSRGVYYIKTNSEFPYLT